MLLYYFQCQFVENCNVNTSWQITQIDSTSIVSNFDDINGRAVDVDNTQSAFLF